MINSLYKAPSIRALIDIFEHKEKCTPQKKNSTDDTQS